jgi:hypothetical protein
VVFQTSYGGAAPAEEPEGSAPRPTSPVADGSPAPASRIPQFQDFVIENLACDGAREAMTIEGLPEAPIRRIVFRNVTISAQKGARLVETEGIRLSGFHILPASGPVLSLASTRDLTLEQGTVPAGVETFIAVTDGATGGVRVKGTDLRRLRTPVALAPGARKDAVTQESPPVEGKP